MTLALGLIAFVLGIIFTVGGIWFALYLTNKEKK